VTYRIRVVNMVNNRVHWEPLPEGYLWSYEHDNPQVSLLVAESFLEMIGEELTGAKPVTVSTLDDEGLMGILLMGSKFGVLVEGAEFLSFSTG
jgi:hypothetical protein